MTEKVVTITGEEARRMYERDRAMLARAKAMSEAELEQAIANDPEWADMDPDWHEDAEFVVPGEKPRD